MKIAESDFYRLIDAVEAQDGRHLDDTCHADEITYEYPDGTTEHRLTTGCEQPTVFEIPYDPTSTVLVQEPILEPDPERYEWADENGDARVTRRTRKNEDGELLWEIVERQGERPDTGVIERSTVIACALDDNVAMWPRFKDVIQDPRSR